MTEWLVACMQVVCAVAAALSPFERNLCKRIPASLATFDVANDKDDDNERKYIKFIRNVNILSTKLELSGNAHFFYVPFFSFSPPFPPTAAP